MSQHGREGDVMSTCDSVSVLEPQGHINEVYYLVWRRLEMPATGLRS